VSGGEALDGCMHWQAAAVGGLSFHLIGCVSVQRAMLACVCLVLKGMFWMFSRGLPPLNVGLFPDLAIFHTLFWEFLTVPFLLKRASLFRGAMARATS